MCNDEQAQKQADSSSDAVQDSHVHFIALNGVTFKYFFVAANEELIRIIEALKLEEVLLVDDSKCKEQLDVLRRLFTLLEILVSVTRKNDKQAILTATLRYFSQFMTIFLGPCMSFLKKILQRFPSDVVSIIKTVQRSTRQIQSLCAHAKATKDSATLSHVPRIKKQLEQLIYQIKDTLKKLGAEDAFWLGNLKNRYLNGEEIVDEEEIPTGPHKRGRRKNVEESEEKRVCVEPKEETGMDEEAEEVSNDDSSSSTEEE